MELPERIVLDPEIMGGKPTIRGTRITVGTILNQLRFQSREELLQDYPELTPEDIDAALAYAALLAEEREMPL
ncbi:protein of unknown function DUF433 [Rhodothermus marinus SG0.5JP17-172]|jgi:uncharacterized protein (DUF433 family)|uniref:DUF433 domain-containing protein n=1 Tax=Rhodothermus marinus TaxID=29549 RepID=UPI000223DE8A|nr:DUF433 domain-containing protein [Rhodothermus marinus]AEN74541.1 protein of unknown function DUF433 [Rhodothermus marinus SG0.5JP17-172]MBO2491872.1 DUF433 domain-containing protein [Rhodothermus marinus]